MAACIVHLARGSCADLPTDVSLGASYCGICRLSTDARVAAITKATTTTEQIAQLTNAAPAIERVGLPA